MHDTMVLATRPLGPMGANCFILGDPATRQAALIDPGIDDPWIWSTLQQFDLQLHWVLLTHAHLDHIGGVAAAVARTGVPVLLHPGDADMLQDPHLNFSAFSGPAIALPPPDREIQEGETLQLGELGLQVLHVPGHSPGSACFYSPAAGLVIAGDTLFAGSVGRTDLPGGSHQLLVSGIKRKLLTLPPDTVVYPGHGPQTSVADEAEYNPFLSGA